MLYILRRGKEEHFIVRDTDDGVDQEASTTELLHVHKLGIEVKGVSIDLSTGTISIKPYSIENNAKTTKLQFLEKIQLTVSDGVLTDAFNHKDYGNCKIRLSDYCSSIADYAIRFYVRPQHTLELIFDDKISFTELSFARHICSPNVLFNISEMSDGKFSDIIYSKLIYSGATEIIVDNNIDRRRRWACVQLVEQGKQGIDKITVDFKHYKYDDFIYSKYYEVFRYFEKEDICIMLETSNTSFERIKTAMDVEDYNFIYGVLTSSTDYINSYVKILINYVKYFNLHKDVREILNNVVKKYIKRYEECYL